MKFEVYGSLHPATINSYYLGLQVCSGRALLEYQTVFNRNAYSWNTRTGDEIKKKFLSI